MPHDALAPALLSLVLALPAAAGELEGSWSLRESGRVGPASVDALRFSRVEPEGWRAVGLLGGPRGRPVWEGRARVQSDTVVVSMGTLRGAADALEGRSSSEVGEATFRRLGDLLLGSWRERGSSQRAVFVREGSVSAAKQPSGGIEVLAGRFGADAQSWPQLNANHPEILTAVPPEGAIVVSTLPPAGRADPGVHLDHPFEGPFRIFVSNQNRTGRRIWQAVVLCNVGRSTATIEVRALSSASTREAPYTDLGWGAAAAIVEPGSGRSSGPGEAAATAALQGQVAGARARALAAGEATLLSLRPLRSREERMTHAHLVARGRVAAAVLYLPGPQPDLKRVRTALRRARRAARSQHDRAPSPPTATSGALIFGRVSGIVASSHWEGRVSNDARGELFLTHPGEERAFRWNAKLGATGRAQSAPLLARLPDSAYRSWGNYGGTFALRGALRNPTRSPQRVSLLVDCEGHGSARALRQGFELLVQGPAGLERRWARASLRMGARSEEPLFQVEVPPGSARLVTLRCVYAANNTAPVILRLRVEPAG